MTNPLEGDGIPYFLIDVAFAEAGPSARIVDSLGGGVMGLKLPEVSVKGDQLVLVMEMSAGQAIKMTVRLRKVGDHLEGTATAEGQEEVAILVGKPTTKDKLDPPKIRPQAADQKALTAAMMKPPAERTDALKQFLKDYPDSAQKERAHLQYKLKDYVQAEVELKRAIEIAGADSDGDAQLFLGKTYEATGREDAALNAYFAAATTASSKEIKTSLERMWVKKNGGTAGLDAKLDEIYKARPKAFEPGRYVPDAAKKTGRVVLAELFTGAECGPCVAADLAFDGLAERYDRATVAVLVYHMHIPGPDPMTNADTEARGAYYGVNGTPTSVVDGLESQMGGGGSAQASRTFDTLKGKVESRLAVAPLATLNGFKAKVAGQTINVSGQAGLLPAGADKVKKATLRVALVQNLVRYTGANGVRFHTFVVRKLMGPPAGTLLQTAGRRTEFSASVDVTKLGDSLDAYLTKFEKDRSEARGAFAFSDTVAKIDPKQLWVVAFVQDDQTKEILQSVFVTPGR